MVAIIDDSIVNGIVEHGLSNVSFKVRLKNHVGPTKEDICDQLKPEIRKKLYVAVIQAGTNDLTNNSKSL